MSTNKFLTPHFTLLEMTESQTAKKHNIVNVAPPVAVQNLRRLCEHTLEPLREKMGLPIIITSGYRCPQLNEIIVHSARKSQHMAGQAADFYVVSGLDSHRELLIKAVHLIITDEEIDFDQLIIYPSFIHVSYVSKERNRHQLTRAFSNGSYSALTRTQALSLV